MLPILLLVGISVAADGSGSPSEPVLTDSLGDPLPPGALARMGGARFGHGGGKSLAFARDGETLVTGGYDGVRLWDAATGRLKQRFDFEAKWVSDVAFTADGVAVAGVTSAKTGPSVTLWLCD